MKILLTGSSGMVGRNLLDHQESKKYKIITPSSRELDLLDYEKLLYFLNKNKPDLIIHLAAKVGGIQANINDPFLFLNLNLKIGLNMVNASFENNIKKFINVSSSCVYPSIYQEPIKENYLLQGPLEKTNEGYALAKIAVMKLCEYISNMNQGFFYKTLIPCNLYGKNDNFDLVNAHLIPAIIRKTSEAIKQNKDIEIWGNGSARREFMYAGDFADSIFYFLEKIEKMPNAINIGLGDDYSVYEYYKIIAEKLKFKGKFLYDLTKPDGMKRKLLCTSNLKKYSWKPKHSLSEGLDKTIEYFKKYYE